MSDDNDSELEDLRADNDPGSENEEDLASIGKDGEISSDDAQFLKNEVCFSTQKVEKKKDKSGNKPKFKMKTLTIDGQLVYFCKICDKIFTRRKDKLNHELAHSGETMLTCTECGKEYLHESSLASHMRTHDGDPLFMCDLCPKMFAQSHHLKTHILSHSEPTTFTCKTCYKEFATAIDLNHHNRSLISQEMSHNWCKMCKVYFCRTHGPECHRRIHAYCCSACNELFYTQKKLRIHMKKFAHYSRDKPDYIEPLAEEEMYFHKQQENKKSQSAKENSILKQSFQNVPTKDNKRCAEDRVENTGPRKKFKLSPRKIMREDEQSSTSYHDSAPDRKQETESEVRSPSKCRKGKPYCKKCNRSFKDSLDLDRHRSVVHSDISVDSPNIQQVSSLTPFSCKICSAAFATKEDLERHGFKHSGERMHVCPMCGEEFPQALQLTKHLKTHMGDHPYRCSQCGKSFRLKIQLIQHVRLHIVQDANSCDKCPSKFNTRAELQDHMLQAHREALKCHLCGKTFNHRERLLTHLRLQHCLTEPQNTTQGVSQFGLKRSVSSHHPKDLISYSNIKSEPYGSDCESEQSFCSSFTRDSEKSDVFKYSSDESYSFKTTMAKERIRLRRKWRRSRASLLEQGIAHKHVAIKNLKEEPNENVSPEVKNEIEADEGIDGGEAQAVLDLMVELNIVKCEKENFTTVYADVTHKLPVKQELLPLAEVEKPVLHNFGPIDKNMSDLSMSRDEAVHNFSHGLKSIDILSRLSNCNEKNMLMFEFDPEELGITAEDLPITPQKDFSLPGDSEDCSAMKNSSNEPVFDSSKFPPVVSVSTNTVTTSTISCGLAVSATATSSTVSTSHSQSLTAIGMSTSHNAIPKIPAAMMSPKFNTISTVSAAEKSPTLRTISDLSYHEASSINSHAKSSTSDTISGSSSSISGLARLQQVFQNSSKYLPLNHQTKKTETSTFELDINSTSQSFDIPRATNIDPRVTSSRNMHSQVLSGAAIAEKISKCQEGVAKFEPVFVTPTAKGQPLNKTQTSKTCRSNLKENRKAPVKLIKSEVTPVLPNDQRSQTSTHQAYEKSHLPQPNTSHVSSRHLSSFSSSYPSVSSSSPNCHGHIPTSNISHSSRVSTILTTISTLGTSTSCISQQHALHPSHSIGATLSTPSYESVPASSATVIQPSSIFDTSNPLLRDMNMMDLVRACTPAPRPAVIPTPLPQAEVLQLLQPQNIPIAPVMTHPVGASLPSIPDALPPPPAQILPPTFPMPQPPSMSILPHSVLPRSNEMTPQLLQPSDTISSYSSHVGSNISNNQLPAMKVQELSTFTAQNLPVQGLTHQDFPTHNPIYPPGPSSAYSTPLQGPQHELMAGPSDISTLMNLNNMLGLRGSATPCGLIGNDSSSSLSLHMKSIQESALKEFPYLNAAHTTSLQQPNFNGILVGGLNPQLQPSMGGLGCVGFNPGPLNSGTGNMIGQMNFQSFSGGPSVELGGHIAAAPQPQMVNVLNSGSSSGFPNTIGLQGLGLFGHHPSSQLNASLVNPPMMVPGGHLSMPANLLGVFGSQEPRITSFPPHFTGFPHL